MQDNSILNDIKKLLGLDKEYDVFDQDIIIHINSVFATLQQLGVGPEVAFFIEDDTATWSQFFEDVKDAGNLNDVKTYIYLRVRVIFDPPSTSYAIESFKKMAKELEWRMNVQAEGVT